MTQTLEQIKNLRQATGAGVMDCRLALEQAQGDYDQALSSLYEKAAAKAVRSERQANQGHIELYSHGDGRIGVMVELSTETDFAGRSELFRRFAHEIALQIAAAGPLFVREEDVPAQVVAEETQKATLKARRDGKPEAITTRIVEGALKKYLDQAVLLRQVYIRDDGLTIGDLLRRTAASVGEKIVIQRFARWEVVQEGAPEGSMELGLDSSWG